MFHTVKLLVRSHASIGLGVWPGYASQKGSFYGKNHNLAPEEALVNNEDKRIEIEDLVGPHLVPGAPYYWWKDPEANERTFQESEAEGGFDTEPIHATIDDQLCDLRFEEVEPDD